MGEEDKEKKQDRNEGQGILGAIQQGLRGIQEARGADPNAYGPVPNAPRLGLDREATAPAEYAAEQYQRHQAEVAAAVARARAPGGRASALAYEDPGYAGAVRRNNAETKKKEEKADESSFGTRFLRSLMPNVPGSTSGAPAPGGAAPSADNGVVSAPPPAAPGGGGYGGVPARYGWIPQNRETHSQIQGGIALSPATIAARDAAANGDQSLLDTSKETERAHEKANVQEGLEREFRATNLKNRAAGVQQFEQHQRLQEDAARKQIELQQRDLDEVKIDPGRFWDSRNAFQQASGVLGMIAGAFAEGFSGGKLQNSAYKIIQDKIGEDVTAQRENLSRIERGMQGKRTALAELIARGDSQRAAETRLAQLQNEHYAAQLEAVAAGTKNADQKQKLAEFRQQLLDRSAQLGLEYDKLTSARQTVTSGGTEHYGILPGTGTGTGGMGGFGREYKMGPEETTVRLPNGDSVVVHKEAEDDVRKAVTGMGVIQRGAAVLRNLYSNQPTIPALSPAWRDAVHAAQNQIAYGEQLVGGRGGKGTMDESMKVLQGTSILGWHPGQEAALEKVVRGAQDRAQASIDAAARGRVRPVVVNNARGQQETKHVYLGEYQGQSSAQMPATVPIGRTK